MGIIDYYNLAFSNRETSFSTHVHEVDSLISTLIKNLPKKIHIEDNKSGKEFLIDLTEDSSISNYEFILLNKLFYQYSVIYEDSVKYTFYDFDDNTSTAEDYFNRNTGVLRLLKSILFLDFYNSLDLVYGVFSLYDMIPFLDLRTIPVSDKKDMLLNQKRYIADKLRELGGQYDVLNIEYVDYLKKVETLNKLIYQIEVKASVDEAKSNDPVLRDVSNYKNRLVKMQDVHSRVESKISDWKFDLDQLKINERDVSRQKKLSAKIKKWAKVSAKLNGSIKITKAEISNYEDVLKKDSSTIESRKSEYAKKINDLKERLVTAEDTKTKLYERLSEIKNSSNSLKMELQSIENRMATELTIVDTDKLVSKNILSIDRDITVGEKLFRFLSNYFISMSQSSFISLQDRRALVVRLFPDIKVKSFSTIDGVFDDKHFITVG